MDEKPPKCIFLEYVDNDIGYQLWDPLKRRVIGSRDVIFNEEQMFKITDKGVEMHKFVEIQGKQENQPPLKEFINEHPLQQNENEDQQQEKNEEQYPFWMYSNTISSNFNPCPQTKQLLGKWNQKCYEEFASDK